MSDQLQAVRDEIAEMCGYRFIVDREMGPVGWELRGGAFFGHHPIPACLNFVSRVWPDGWVWCRGWPSVVWATCRSNDAILHGVHLQDTDDELTDRMTLLLKVLKWLRDNDRPAFDAACEKIRKEIGK